MEFLSCGIMSIFKELQILIHFRFGDLQIRGAQFVMSVIISVIMLVIILHPRGLSPQRELDKF